MEDAWYYVNATQSADGPHSRERLEALYASGRLRDNTLIWNSSMTAWTPYGESGLLTALMPTIPPPIPHRSKTDSAAQITISPTNTIPSSALRSSQDSNPMEPFLDLDALVTSDLHPEVRDSIANNPQNRENRLDPPAQPVSDDGWQCVKPAPWRRYFARMLDSIMLGVLIWFVLGLFLGSFNANLYRVVFGQNGLADNDVISSIITFFLVAPLEALLIGTTGTTLGKWVFGIRITDTSGHPIGLLNACRREVQVLLRGLGFGIPLISFITMVLEYRKLRMDGATSWDKSQPWVITYRRSGPLQIIFFILGICLFFSILFALQIAKKSNW